MVVMALTQLFLAKQLLVVVVEHLVLGQQPQKMVVQVLLVAVAHLTQV
jgi:hypothetical protein